MVVELLKNRKSEFKNQLDEKNVAIYFLLHEGLKSKLKNTSFTSKVSNDNTQYAKNK